jgi:hypothetical protein
MRSILPKTVHPVLYGLASLFLLLLVAPSASAATVSSTFPGTAIDAEVWAEHDTDGTGGTTGNVQQDDGLSIQGVGTWMQNGLASVIDFGRAGTVLSTTFTVTSNTAHQIPLGYGDWDWLSNSGYLVYFSAAGEIRLITVEGGSFTENDVVASYEAGTYTVEMRLNSSGADVYLDSGSGLALLGTLDNGTFTDKKFFSQAYSSSPYALSAVSINDPSLSFPYTFTFPGTSIDSVLWTEVDTSGAGGTVGNVQQDDGLSIQGSESWMNNGIASASTFGRTGTVLSETFTVTSNTAHQIPLGYGDWYWLYGGSGHLVYFSAAGEIRLITVEGGSFTENDVVDSYEAGTYTVEMRLNSSGADVYLDSGSGLELLGTLDNGTFTDKQLFSQGYTASPYTVSQIIVADPSYTAPPSPLVITSPSHDVPEAPTTATLAITDEGGTFFIPYIQTGSTLNVAASIGGDYLPESGGVKFVLNEGLSGQRTSYDMAAPFTAAFSGVAKGTYTLDVYAVDASQDVAEGVGRHAALTDIGIGDIITAIGDSITEGEYGVDAGSTPITSWLDAPSGTVSSDNRNYPQYGPYIQSAKESWMSDLNDALSSMYGYPVFIMNEGYGGMQTGSYITYMEQSDWIARQTALHPNRWLIHLGVNDAGTGNQSASTVETNLQTIIDTLENEYGATGAQILLAKPSYGTTSNYYERLPAYMPMIDDLVIEDGLARGPDFYSYFAEHYSTMYADFVHPNEDGMAQMAHLWALALMAPQHLVMSQSAGVATLSWDDLSTFDETIEGYRVKYGTGPGTYTTTIDVGGVTSAEIDDLTVGETYYFTVSAYDGDTTPNETGDAAELATMYLAAPHAFPGTTIDTGLWTEVDGSGSGGTVGNVQQDDGLSIQGAGYWMQDGISSANDLTREGTVISTTFTVTSNTAHQIPLGYGDWYWLSNSGYLVYFSAAGEIRLITVNGGSFTENDVVASYEAGTYTVEMRLHATGADVYLDSGSGLELLGSLETGTFTDKRFFSQGYSASPYVLSGVSITEPL